MNSHILLNLFFWKEHSCKTYVSTSLRKNLFLDSLSTLFFIYLMQKFLTLNFRDNCDVNIYNYFFLYLKHFYFLYFFIIISIFMVINHFIILDMVSYTGTKIGRKVLCFFVGTVVNIKSRQTSTLQFCRRI